MSLVIPLLLFSCRCDDDDPVEPGSGEGEKISQPTPYELEIPRGFPHVSNLLPADNPLTVEGIALGRRLFYEKKLSLDESMSCATCHDQAHAFTDRGFVFSEGITGEKGTRNSMQLVNLAWSPNLFWDGRSNTLEEQAIDPVVNPLEMNSSWPLVVDRLKGHPEYPALFKRAFGTTGIDSVRVVKAIAQFERSLVSSDAKIDRYLRGEYTLTYMEREGKKLFEEDRDVIRDPDTGEIIGFVGGADCDHCHMGTASLLLTNHRFHNNGLDPWPLDSGLASITRDPADMGKFRTPSLRNISYTAPYMHDGRFKTLDEVIDFYSEGLHVSPTIDPLMKNVAYGGLNLSPMEKAQLKAFLLTFDDETFINNPAYGDPNKE